jgi:hypothetical protein
VWPSSSLKNSNGPLSPQASLEPGLWKSEIHCVTEAAGIEPASGPARSAPPCTGCPGRGPGCPPGSRSAPHPACPRCVAPGPRLKKKMARGARRARFQARAMPVRGQGSGEVG